MASSTARKDTASDIPRILLLDTPEDITKVVCKNWRNVDTGTFGPVFRVARDESHNLPAIEGAKLPRHFAESDIIVIDLAPRSAVYPHAPQERYGHSYPLVNCERGAIDPRPLSMMRVEDQFNRIFSHGGMFVLFVEPRTQWTYLVGPSRLEFDNYNFLGVLGQNHVNVEPDRGREIHVLDVGEPLSDIARLVAAHTPGATFSCVLGKGVYLNLPFTRLAVNKFGQCVAAAIGPSDHDGWIFLLPRLSRLGDFMTALLTNVLPELCPRFFPQFEGRRWIRRPQYELPIILQLNAQIARVKEAAREQIAGLEASIAAERTEWKFLQDLLVETGKPLVEAVKRGLALLGFRKIVDVDEAAVGEEGQATPQKREDIQIHDISPTLLLEVKGIGGLPSESDSLQVTKYLIPRMKEWNRTDVQGLSIINHQRHLPPLDRNNGAVFQSDVLSNAEHQHFGLMTSWDLYRMIRSYLKLGWKQEEVRAALYKTGRIEAVPNHYEYVGVVEHFYPGASAVTVQVTGVSLKLGDRIAFEFAIEYGEQDIQSLQVDNKPREDVTAGEIAGILTSFSRDEMKRGIRVFRVNRLR